MDKTKIFKALITDLIVLAEDLQELVDIMELAEQVSQVSVAIEVKPEAPTVTLEEVRAVLAQKSNEGKATEIKALLEKYGAQKLSSVDSAQFGALLVDAEAL